MHYIVNFLVEVINIILYYLRQSERGGD